MTRVLSRIVVLFCLLLPLGGCVGFTLAKGGETLEISDGVSVQPARDWNRLSVGKYEYWTLDGLHLQNILFVKGIEDGEGIVFRRNTSDDPEEDTFPKFKTGMTLLELRELLEATWTRQNYHRISITKFGPAGFGGKDGFEIAYTYDTKDGLEMRGRGAGAVVDGKLFMVLYSGTRIHFFERGENDFTKILESVRFPARPSS